MSHNSENVILALLVIACALVLANSLTVPQKDDDQHPPAVNCNFTHSDMSTPEPEPSVSDIVKYGTVIHPETDSGIPSPNGSNASALGNTTTTSATTVKPTTTTKPTTANSTVTRAHDSIPSGNMSTSVSGPNGSREGKSLDLSNVTETLTPPSKNGTAKPVSLMAGDHESNMTMGANTENEKPITEKNATENAAAPHGAMDKNSTSTNGTTLTTSSSMVQQTTEASTDVSSAPSSQVQIQLLICTILFYFVHIKI